jgi:N-acetylmuramoyl-L-alanine amidase
LAKSKEKQESLENSNQSAQNEIDTLKSDIENAKGQIATLKGQLDEQLKDSEDKIRIYIDQGHNPTSYHNSGASGNGLYEQDITFLVGCLLADLLRADGRFEVQLSRPNKSVVLGTDNKSSLMARVEGAAAFEADYLISLHTNSFDQDTANGIEVYVAEKPGESYILAETLLTELVASTNLRKREVKLEPGLDILEFSVMPAVLVEMGFISNSTDAALMSKHPELFAQGLYNGIMDYFGLLPNVLGAK